MRLEVPHFAFPFVHGDASMVEQDSAEHVLSCELTIIHCPLGFRIDRPDFGIPYLDYRVGNDTSDSLEASLRKFEPRSNLSSSQIRDWQSEAESIITIEVEVT